MWISEQTAIISLYNINWLVFITETECVYCAVRAGSLYIIQVNLVFKKLKLLLKLSTLRLDPQSSTRTDASLELCACTCMRDQLLGVLYGEKKTLYMDQAP